jgi:surface-anchored protein
LGRISHGALRVARAILTRGYQFKPVTLSALAAVGALALAGAARAAELPVLNSGHTDVGVNFEAGVWDLHVHAEELGLEYEPDGVRLQVGSQALTRVPTHAAFSFLGEAGAPIWVLPALENHDLLFLGLGTEELAAGIFAKDTVTLTLKSVTGPGDFILYTLDMFGAPVVSMNSRDGIDAGDARTLSAGGHVHVNWVFTAPGQYRIGLQASGVLAATGATNTSEVAEYLFEVQYAPILSVKRKDAATLTLQWLSREQHEYHLQSTADLVGGPWAAHPGVDPVEGTGQFMALEVPVEKGPRYFRLEIHEEEGHYQHD